MHKTDNLPLLSGSDPSYSSSLEESKVVENGGGEQYYTLIKSCDST